MLVLKKPIPVGEAHKFCAKTYIGLVCPNTEW